MYLSRVMLDADKRETLKALTSPQLMHAAIEDCFEGERQRRLWRIDQLSDNLYILILSQQKPNFHDFTKRFATQTDSNAAETKEYEPFLNRLKEGQIWRFRLRANPVHSISEKRNASQRGKVMAHVTTQYQKQWLLDRAQKYGFSLDEEAFDVVHTQWLKFEKGGSGKVSILAVSFEGLLTIQNTEKFKQALITGIGRGKAYGCGLLTIVR